MGPNRAAHHVLHTVPVQLQLRKTHRTGPSVTELKQFVRQYADGGVAISALTPYKHQAIPSDTHNAFRRVLLCLLLEDLLDLSSQNG